MMKQQLSACLSILLVCAALLALLSGCGEKWVCDKCDKEFSGDAYYGMMGTETFCEDCARKYWMPIPYQNYKK